MSIIKELIFNLKKFKMDLIIFLEKYWQLLSIIFLILFYFSINIIKIRNKDYLYFFIDLLFYLIFFLILFELQNYILFNDFLNISYLVLIVLLRGLFDLLIKKNTKYNLIFFIFPLIIYYIINTNIDWFLSLIC